MKAGVVLAGSAMKAGVVLAGSAMKAGVLTTGVVRLMAGVLFADMVQ